MHHQQYEAYCSVLSCGTPGLKACGAYMLCRVAILGFQVNTKAYLYFEYNASFV